MQIAYPNLKQRLLLNNLKYIFLLVICILPGTSIAQDLIFSDHVYEEYKEYIKTIRIISATPGPDQELLPAAISMVDPGFLMLEFDDLFAEYERYQVKFIHCDADWTPSRLFPLDYLDEYNEFIIENYEFSFNTIVPYVHYSFQIPRFKLPGNYLLVVYKDSEDNVVITRRVLVYDQKFTMKENLEMAGLSRIGRMTQEIRFTLDYKGFDVPNPARNIKAIIRQNQRWDNAIINLRPTNVWENSKIIEYKHFALENQFQGGNQFRFFDLRSIEYFGRNVETVDKSKDIPVATIMKDKSRANKAYSEYVDNNGGYKISHPIDAEYVFTEFFLESKKINGEVFIGGEINGWELNTPLKYIEGKNVYYSSILIKEGYYDYQYVVKSLSIPLNYFEGDHFETENEYDILIYFHSFTLGADLLWGYFPITRNGRN